MKIVTFETAKALKAAGLPQPELKPGQFWYAEPCYKGGKFEHVPLCVVVEGYKTLKPMLRRLTCKALSGEYGGKPDVFAPTLEDIFREIQPVTITAYRDGSWRIQNEFCMSFLDPDVSYPAECAALFYLKLKEQEK